MSVKLGTLYLTNRTFRLFPRLSLILPIFYLFLVPPLVNASTLPFVIAEKRLNGIEIEKLNAIHQGKNSLWLGGRQGLFEVSGLISHHYHVGNSPLSRHEILDIIEDPSGKVWLATDGGGIHIFEPDSNRFKHLDVSNGLSSNLVLSLTFFNDNYLIATTFNGIAIINLETLVVEDLFAQYQEEKLSISTAQFAEVDKQGRVYFTQGRNSFYIFDYTAKQLKEVTKAQSRIEGETIADINIDTHGNLWLTTEAGVNKLSDTSQLLDFYPLPTQVNTSQYENLSLKTHEDSNGTIWLAANHLYKLDQATKTLSKINSKEPNDIQQVRAMTNGNNDELFIVSHAQGLLAFPATSHSISPVLSGDEEILGDINHALALEDDTVLIAAADKLHHIKHTSHNIIVIPDEAVVSALTLFGANQVLVAADTGRIYMLDIKQGMLLDISGDFADLPPFEGAKVNQLMVLDNGELIVGLSSQANSGLYQGKLGGKFRLIFPNYVEGIIKNKVGKLVVTTRDGIFEQKNADSWIEWNDAKSRENYSHNCLRSDSSGTIWVCTNDYGLAYLDASSQEIQYLDQHFTANTDTIRDVIQDPSGYYWITTNRGLVRYDSQLQHAIVFDHSLSIADSDFKPATSAILAPSHLFIVALSQAYMLDTIELNAYLDERTLRQTEVIFDEFYTHRGRENIKHSYAKELHDTLLNPVQSLQVAYNEFLISFKFTTNNFLDRNNLGYEYRLQGLNDQWLQLNSESNLAAFITLSPQDYVFEVRVKDQRSTAQQPISRLKLNVSPPIWRTWSAFIIYAIIGLLLVFSFYKFRTAKLKRTNVALEKAVNQRTKQLNESNQKVSSLLKKKQSFFTSVSHEFRTPLALILGPLDLLLNKINDPSLVQHIQLINRNAKRLNKMVDQILELARLDEVNALDYKVYSAEQALNAIVQPFISMADMKNHQLIVNIDTQYYLRLIDDSLEKIVSNLLSNALKFSPENSTIKLATNDTPDYLVLTVADNGIGIDKAFHESIFERFSRIDGSEDIPGSGIGLALVKELVESNHGFITVESNLQQGTSFTVHLPVLKEVDAKSLTLLKPSYQPFYYDATVQPPAVTEFISEQTEGRDTLLIVEDNSDMRTFIAEQFNHSYHCIIAKNGQDGIDLAIEKVPDIIISDVMMPLVDGFTLSKTLREDQTTSHIPIILLTAKGDNDSRLHGWKLDIDDYIAKPFNIDELRARVARLLAIRKLLKKKYSRKVEMAIESQTSESISVNFNHKSEQKFFEKFTQVINENYHLDTFSRAEAAEKLAVSERQLNRKLSALIDYNFSEYLRKYRLSKAKSHLESGRQITEVSYSVGFSSPSYFSSCFKAEFGVSPKELISAKN